MRQDLRRIMTILDMVALGIEGGVFGEEDLAGLRTFLNRSAEIKRVIDEKEGIMTTERVLEVVLREMTAYGQGWRMNWNDFDGRTLRSQLNGIEKWARGALAGEHSHELTVGTDFLRENDFLRESAL